MKSANYPTSEGFVFRKLFTFASSGRAEACCTAGSALKRKRVALGPALLSMIVAVCLNTAAYAQDPDGQSPNRGFLPNGSYALSDIESISLSGGNMTYAIPLAALPASRGGKLKPAVSLLYNSKIYDTSAP